MNTRLRDIFMKFDSLSRSGINKFRPSLMLKISNKKWVKLKCYRFSEVLWFKFPGRVISQSFKIFEAKIHLLETAISKVFFEECLHSNSKVKLGNQIMCSASKNQRQHFVHFSFRKTVLLYQNLLHFTRIYGLGLKPFRWNYFCVLLRNKVLD